MTEDTLMQALRTVIDPEIGINIVDLGLVYGTQIQGGYIQVKMTMTTPVCPLSEYLQRMVVMSVRRADTAVESVEINFIWDPPWNPKMMSAAARRQLGWTR